MNHFPLFAIMLRLKDPARLPGSAVSRSDFLHGADGRLLIFAVGGVYLVLEGRPPAIVIKVSPASFVRPINLFGWVLRTHPSL
jgi:hypothetical protein